MVVVMRLFSLGAGVGLEIRGDDLAVCLVRSRWKGVTVVAQGLIAGFRSRPASEWGAEYQEFLKGHQFAGQAATLALPREQAIVRLLELPAAAGAELRSAVRFQIDLLHPYGEDGVYSGYARLDRAPGSVAVVLAARAVVDGYAGLFAEAGVKLAGITVAAAGYYLAPRLRGGLRPEPFLSMEDRGQTFELYGESQARPLFSAVFDSKMMPVEKAVEAAAAELRLEPATAQPMESNAAVLATALTGACPRLGWRLNLLPAQHRSSSARWPVFATAAAVAAALLVVLLLWLRGPWQDRRYAQALEREVRRLEAVEREIRALERQGEAARARRSKLESFRWRPEADLALVTEISRRLPATVWLQQLELSEDVAQLAGQAEAAAPLLGLLDNSGVLAGSSFAGSITRNENHEVFRIRAARRQPGR